MLCCLTKYSDVTCVVRSSSARYIQLHFSGSQHDTSLRVSLLAREMGKRERERGGGGGEKKKKKKKKEKRNRQKKKQREKENWNSNSKALFYKDCSLGSKTDRQTDRQTETDGDRQKDRQKMVNEDCTMQRTTVRSVW